MGKEELPLQHDMFTGQMVGIRSVYLERPDPEQNSPQQQTTLAEPVQTSPLVPCSDKGRGYRAQARRASVKLRNRDHQPVKQTDYQERVTKAVRDFVFLARLHTSTADLDLLMMAGATNELITVVLNAYDAGVDRKNLQTVIVDGIQPGKPQTTINTQPFYDATYWQAVYQEAEEFWAKRYDPNALDEW